MSTGTLHIGPLRNASSPGQTDLVITQKGEGQGTIAFDVTLASALLIALGSHRRADPDDTLPSLLTDPNGTIIPLGGKRGWVGDILQAEGQRHGSKLWLLERAKKSEATRITAEDYALAAVEPIGTYHGQEMTVSAQWKDSILMITIKNAQFTVTQRVETL